MSEGEALRHSTTADPLDYPESSSPASHGGKAGLKLFTAFILKEKSKPQLTFSLQDEGYPPPK